MKRILPLLAAMAASQALAQAQQPAPQPETASAAAPPAAEANPAAPVSESAQIEVVTVEDYRSIMFSPDEIEAMQPLIEAFRTGKALPAAPVKAMQQAAPVSSPKIYTYPQFFLESLVYYHTGKWTVWINGQRFTQDTPATGALAIESVSAKEAAILWHPASNERLKWNPAEDGRVIVDSAERTIRFTLQPNQTFSSYSMRVLEGKVQPAEIDLTTPSSQAKTLTVPPVPGAPPARPPQAGEATGLEGLINRYQKYNPKE